MSGAAVRLTLLEKDGNEPAEMAVGQSLVRPFGPSGSLVIGRAPSVDIFVSAPSVGRQAVRITHEQGALWVQDLGSGGGSSVESDGVVTKRPHCLLPNQAILRIGRVAFRVELAGA